VKVKRLRPKRPDAAARLLTVGRAAVWISEAFSLAIRGGAASRGSHGFGDTSGFTAGTSTRGAPDAAGAGAAATAAGAPVNRCNSASHCVFRAGSRIEETRLGGGDFIQDPLAHLGVLAQGIPPHMPDLPLGRVEDHLHIALKPLDSQQPVVIGRLILGRNSQPTMIRIECGAHQIVAATVKRAFLSVVTSSPEPPNRAR
jgi:hypothetical protein